MYISFKLDLDKYNYEQVTDFTSLPDSIMNIMKLGDKVYYKDFANFSIYYLISIGNTVTVAICSDMDYFVGHWLAFSDISDVELFAEVLTGFIDSYSPEDYKP